MVVDGRVRLVRVTARGWVTDIPAREQPAGTRVRVDPRAPARFVRTVTRRTSADVAHLLLDGARWQLVLADGRQFSADRHGRTVRAAKAQRVGLRARRQAERAGHRRVAGLSG